MATNLIFYLDLEVEQLAQGQFAKTIAEAQNKVAMRNYQKLLCTIFPQVKSSSESFALAAYRCTPDHETIKEYLFDHAAEEKTHWRWILDDLKNTGYTGESAAYLTPLPECIAYIALNHYVAMQYPIGRLVIAYILERAAATLGPILAGVLSKAIGIQPEQMTFFVSHTTTDVTHSQEIAVLLKECAFSVTEIDRYVNIGHAARKGIDALYSAGIGMQ